MKKRILVILATLALLLTLTSVMTFAEDDYFTPKYPNATFRYIPHDNRTLIMDYVDREFAACNFPWIGDIVEVTYGTNKDIYTYVAIPQTENPNAYTEGFQDKDGNWGGVYIEPYGQTGQALVGAAKRDEKDNLIYSIESKLAVKVLTDVKSFSFSPSSLKLDSAKLKKFTPTTYDFGSIPYARGDKVTVVYNNGSTRTFTNDGSYFTDGTDDIWLEEENTELKAGNNTVKLWHKGVSTTISVYVETPAMRSAEKEWKGTLNKRIPTVKSPKYKAAKKKIAVSWKKASKKNLKKFTKVEIQVCKDKKFQKANTKRVVVKKSKKSATVKKLKKGTYYVRVRNVKGSGVKKQVSKWSKVKKVKVK